MKLLLDTHAFLWWVTDTPRLPKSVRKAIAEPRHTVFVSAAMGWEVATKHRLGRLPEAERFVLRTDEVLRDCGFEVLPVTMLHALRAGSYTADHADPFDRVFAAQAELEGMVLATGDRAFARFPVEVLW